MAVERPELRLIREALESVLAPTIASSVLFEALSASGGQLPSDTQACLALVHGPLREVLARRARASDAAAIIEDIERTLGALSPSPPPRKRDLEITAAVPLGDEPVLVFVFAASAAFAQRLEAALGPLRVATVPCPDVEKMRKALRYAAPAVALLDAPDFPGIETHELAAELATLPVTSVRAIWGADTPYGAAIMRELMERGAHPTPFDRREGIEPLLDLIRSRQGPPRRM